MTKLGTLIAILCGFALSSCASSAYWDVGGPDCKFSYTAVTALAKLNAILTPETAAADDEMTDAARLVMLLNAQKLARDALIDDAAALAALKPCEMNAVKSRLARHDADIDALADQLLSPKPNDDLAIVETSSS